MRSAVIAALVSALVSAASGVAATKYVLSSTHQIAPPVLAQLAKLKARTSYVQGPAGPTGSAGSPGPSGKDGATGAASILPGERGLPGPEGRQGSAGAAGAQGETGLRGEQGAPGFVSNLTTGEQHIELGYGGGFTSEEATCPEGSAPVSGGWRSMLVSSEPAPNVIVSTSERTPHGWRIEALNRGQAEAATVTVYALCAS